MCAIRKPSRKFLEDPNGMILVKKIKIQHLSRFSQVKVHCRAYLSVDVKQVPVNEQKLKLKWQFPQINGDKRLMDVF